MSFIAGSNNKYSNYPPLMNDGRNFAIWETESTVNSNLQQDAGIKSNWEYRLSLIHI